MSVKVIPVEEINLTGKDIEEYRLKPITTIDELYDLIEEISTLIWLDLGSYYSEKVYQLALAAVLEKIGLTVKIEFKANFTYHGRVVTNRRADLVVSKDDLCILLELKISTNRIITNETERQINYYLSLFKLEHGAIIVFPVSKHKFPSVNDIEVLEETDILFRKVGSNTRQPLSEPTSHRWISQRILQVFSPFI